MLMLCVKNEKRDIKTVIDYPNILIQGLKKYREENESNK
jgi:hypothetical protein